ncbi:MAG: NAD-dependent protein deacetylase [Polyangiaceae bacterium]|nr:NAD-dependent protein deacetylase [Polyangiaceae bacterium]
MAATAPQVRAEGTHGSGPDDVGALVDLVRGRKAVALTGAGISTESGIPDYRGPGTRERARNPIQHRDFVRDAAVRRRYWARAFVGWDRFSRARPNAGHAAVAELEASGAVTAVVTQNVDRLHQAAGSRTVIELHGALSDVRCLGCGSLEKREDVQHRLMLLNPRLVGTSATIAPDGDAELARSIVDDFEVADCLSCNGPLKPDVVFFGGSVPQPVVEAAYQRVDGAEVLLVLGTSLAVYSGFRFVRRAHERGIPVAIVNLGETRADPYAAVRIDRPLGATLTDLADALRRRTDG